MDTCNTIRPVVRLFIAAKEWGTSDGTVRIEPRLCAAAGIATIKDLWDPAMQRRLWCEASRRIIANNYIKKPVDVVWRELSMWIASMAHLPGDAEGQRLAEWRYEVCS